MFVYWDSEAAFSTPEDTARFDRLVTEGIDFDIWKTFPGFGMGLATLLRQTDFTGARAIYDEPNRGEPHGPMSVETANTLVDDLLTYQAEGLKTFTWGGANFDYRLLAIITGRGVECTSLCRNSYDPCFQAICLQGYPVGLNAAASLVSGLPAKEMDGASAPVLWPTEEWASVVEYGKNDVVRLAGVVSNLIKNKGLMWRTKKGGLMLLPFGKLLTVGQCLALPSPTVPAWITNRTDPLELIKWWGD